MTARKKKPAMSGGARKDDGGKLRYDLVPPEGLREIVHVYTVGASKYAPRNWELGTDWMRYFAPMMRHAWAWATGEDRHDDGMHHLASVAWYCLALMTYASRGLGKDDRVKIKRPGGGK